MATNKSFSKEKAVDPPPNGQHHDSDDDEDEEYIDEDGAKGLID